MRDEPGVNDLPDPKTFRPGRRTPRPWWSETPEHRDSDRLRQTVQRYDGGTERDASPASAGFTADPTARPVSPVIPPPPTAPPGKAKRGKK